MASSDGSDMSANAHEQYLEEERRRRLEHRRRHQQQRQQSAHSRRQQPSSNLNGHQGARMSTEQHRLTLAPSAGPQTAADHAITDDDTRNWTLPLSVSGPSESALIADNSILLSTTGNTLRIQPQTCSELGDAGATLPLMVNLSNNTQWPYVDIDPAADHLPAVGQYGGVAFRYQRVAADIITDGSDEAQQNVSVGDETAALTSISSAYISDSDLM